MSPHDYAQLLYEVWENKTAKQQDEILGRFKKLLAKNKDAHLANAIEKQLQKIQEQKERENITYIASGAALSSGQRKKLETLFPKPREFSVHPSLIGGVAVRQKDRVYNATVRRKIETLKWQL